MIILFHANFQGMEESISFTRRDMRDIGLKARKLMRDRVAKGKDINDSKFKKYSDGYAKYKKKLGKNPSIVDMMDSGTLNNGIRVNAISNDTVDIETSLHRNIGEYHQTGTARGNKKREWFGISKSNESVLNKYIQNKINNKITRWNNG